MKEYYCPNYKECRLVKASDFPVSVSEKDNFLERYCENEQKGWTNCKRFISKASLGFCPDFVLPDSDYSTDEIIDKFDNEI